MNNLLNALNGVISFINNFSNLIITYSGFISGLVSRLGNFATVSDSYMYFVVQFIPAPIWAVFLFEITYGSIKLLLSGVKDIKSIIKWW
jgi:hypothetical protein